MRWGILLFFQVKEHLGGGYLFVLKQRKVYAASLSGRALPPANARPSSFVSGSAPLTPTLAGRGESCQKVARTSICSTGLEKLQSIPHGDHGTYNLSIGVAASLQSTITTPACSPPRVLLDRIKHHRYDPGNIRPRLRRYASSHLCRITSLLARVS